MVSIWYPYGIHILLESLDKTGFFISVQLRGGGILDFPVGRGIPPSSFRVRLARGKGTIGDGG